MAIRQLQSHLQLQYELPPHLYEQFVNLGYSEKTFLGKGSYGTTYRCQWSDFNGNSYDCAVKHINFEMKHPYTPVMRALTKSEIQTRRPQDSRWKQLMMCLCHTQQQSVSEETEVTPSSGVAQHGDAIRTELKAINRANHPNVIRLMNVLKFEDNTKNPNPTHVLIFMEVADSDLYAIYKQKGYIFDEVETREYAAQIVRGVKYSLQRVH